MKQFLPQTRQLILYLLLIFVTTYPLMGQIINTVDVNPKEKEVFQLQTQLENNLPSDYIKDSELDCPCYEITVTHITCNGDENGSIELVIDRDCEPVVDVCLEYDQAKGTEKCLPSSKFLGNAQFNGLIAGTYYLVISGANGCTKVEEIEILEPAGLTAEASAEYTELCPYSETEVEITAFGGTEPYSGTGTFFLGVGTHDFFITDASGCETSTSITIEELPLPCVEVDFTDVSCYGAADGTISIDITCGNVVDICLVDANKSQNCYDNNKTLSNAVFTGLIPGTYNVIVTDANGCLVSVEVTISEPEPIIVHLEGSNPQCYGEAGSADLTIIGGSEPYNIDWGGADPEELYAGEYTVWVTDADECEVSASIVITEPEEMLVEVESENASCHDVADGSITVTIDNAVGNYLLCVNSDECFTIESTDGIANWAGLDLEPGIYYINITDENGCEKTLETTIDSPNPLTVEAIPTNPLCFGNLGSVELNIQGGTPPYSIDWSELDPTALSPGEYSLEVMDAGNCAALVEFVITEPEELTLTAEITDLEEFGDGTGAISLEVSGGVEPYEYLWDTGDNTATIEGLQAGTYFVTVLDANGCSISDDFEVNHPSILVDLGVTIEVNIATPDPEEVDELIFALVVTNHDTVEDATGVSVYNPMPTSFPFMLRLDDGSSGSYDPMTGMWNIGTIPAGSYVILVYTTEMLLVAEDKASYDLNTAQILPFDQIDPNLSNNYAEVVVSVGESTGGDDNGIESNGSMASQLALRNHRRIVESNRIERRERTSQMEKFDHVKMLTGNQKSASINEESSGLGMLIPETGPASSKAFISTPADLLGITNAKEIFSVDYLQENNSRRAAILAISTESHSVYEHTKVICDRLVGAELQEIQMIEINGRPFIMSKLVHPGGYVDYAVSFIAQRVNDRVVVDNRWYNEEYSIEGNDDIFNFQVWSVTPQFTKQLVADVLTRLEQGVNIEYRNEEETPKKPGVYVKSGRYNNGGLHLNIVNELGANNINIYGSKTTYENGQRVPFQMSVDISTDKYSEVFIPTGHIFDAGFSISNNKNDAPDILYYADGAWMFDYDPGNSMVRDFETTPEDSEIKLYNQKVERSASISGDVKTWVSMFRSLSPRNLPVDLSSYDEIRFTASGEGLVEVMLAKEGVHAWSEQFRTQILLTDKSKDYVISLSDLTTRAGEQGFTGEDVVSVIFNPIGNGSSFSNFEVNVSDIRFTQSLLVEKAGAAFYPAFPNPFRGSTQLQIAVNEQSPVKVEVLNMFGQTVDVLVNEVKERGYYSITWEPKSLTNGIYMIRMNVGSEVYTSKVVYQR